MKKENKIIVAVAADPDTRKAMLKRIIIDLGFAITPSDAGKLIKPTPHDINLSTAYFVFAELYAFKDSNITTQRLYELAARGFAVVIGTKKIPPEYEFLCTVYYAENFTRL
ncbi:MAG: hypothetical protein EGP82_01945 [Odoribacter splanchnicus]|nr:hypothetical protein [Odoribacter splanchnicus]